MFPLHHGNFKQPGPVNILIGWKPRNPKLHSGEVGKMSVDRNNSQAEHPVCLKRLPLSDCEQGAELDYSILGNCKDSLLLSNPYNLLEVQVKGSLDVDCTGSFTRDPYFMKICLSDNNLWLLRPVDHFTHHSTSRPVLRKTESYSPHGGGTGVF